jgi:NitT/TauT family transport system substrate-binding protein
VCGGHARDAAGHRFAHRRASLQRDEERGDIMISRRAFVRHCAIAGAVGPLAFNSDLLAAEPAPETSGIRLTLIPGSCFAPQYVAEEMLRAEGFAEVRYVRMTSSAELYPALASGEIDMTMAYIGPFVVQADAGSSIVMLAGIHPGCQELFGSSRVHSVRDLKGKTVAVPGMNSASHLFVATMAVYVGLDAGRDITWVVLSSEEAQRQLADGRIDAFIGGPPLSYEMRAKRIGHVVVNMAVDRPWSTYFCCVLTGHREFVRKNPVATKRAMRAILKGANLCVSSPEPTARLLAGRGFASSYDMALRLVREVPYARWRDYSTEDSVRFYALRLQEAGFIKSSPKRIIEQGTDSRFLNELKRELKI